MFTYTVNSACILVCQAFKYTVHNFPPLFLFREGPNRLESFRAFKWNSREKLRKKGHKIITGSKNWKILGNDITRQTEKKKAGRNRNWNKDKNKKLYGKQERGRKRERLRERERRLLVPIIVLNKCVQRICKIF